MTPSCGQRSTPSWRRIKQTDGNSGTPIDVLLADAVVEAVSGERSGERRVPEICVHIDYDTMLNGLHEHSVCETADGIPLPPETVRRLACEAAIVPIVLNGAGEVLDCGREHRVANRAQRRALRAMYRTCGYPGCDVDVRSLRHPPRHRMAPPRNDRSRQSAPVCSSKHHHLVHEGRWRLTLDQHRVLTIHRPDGTRHFHGTTINRTGRDGHALRPAAATTRRDRQRRRVRANRELSSERTSRANGRPRSRGCRRSGRRSTAGPRAGGGCRRRRSTRPGTRPTSTSQSSRILLSPSRSAARKRALFSAVQGRSALTVIRITFGTSSIVARNASSDAWLNEPLLPRCTTTAVPNKCRSRSCSNTGIMSIICRLYSRVDHHALDRRAPAPRRASPSRRPRGTGPVRSGEASWSSSEHGRRAAGDARAVTVVAVGNCGGAAVPVNGSRRRVHELTEVSDGLARRHRATRRSPTVWSGSPSTTNARDPTSRPATAPRPEHPRRLPPATEAPGALGDVASVSRPGRGGSRSMRSSNMSVLQCPRRAEVDPERGEAPRRRALHGAGRTPHRGRGVALGQVEKMAQHRPLRVVGAATPAGRGRGRRGEA